MSENNNQWGFFPSGFPMDIRFDILSGGGNIEEWERAVIDFISSTVVSWCNFDVDIKHTARMFFYVKNGGQTGESAIILAKRCISPPGTYFYLVQSSHNYGSCPRLIIELNTAMQVGVRTPLFWIPDMRFGDYDNYDVFVGPYRTLTPNYPSYSAPYIPVHPYAGVYAGPFDMGPSQQGDGAVNIFGNRTLRCIPGGPDPQLMNPYSLPYNLAGHCHPPTLISLPSFYGPNVMVNNNADWSYAHQPYALGPPPPLTLAPSYYGQDHDGQNPMDRGWASAANALGPPPPLTSAPSYYRRNMAAIEEPYNEDPSYPQDQYDSPNPMDRGWAFAANDPTGRRLTNPNTPIGYEHSGWTPSMGAADAATTMCRQCGEPLSTHIFLGAVLHPTGGGDVPSFGSPSEHLWDMHRRQMARLHREDNFYVPFTRAPDTMPTGGGNIFGGGDSGGGNVDSGSGSGRSGGGGSGSGGGGIAGGSSRNGGIVARGRRSARDNVANGRVTGTEIIDPRNASRVCLRHFRELFRQQCLDMLRRCPNGGRSGPSGEYNDEDTPRGSTEYLNNIQIREMYRRQRQESLWGPPHGSGHVLFGDLNDSGRGSGPSSENATGIAGTAPSDFQLERNYWPGNQEDDLNEPN